MPSNSPNTSAVPASPFRRATVRLRPCFHADDAGEDAPLPGRPMFEGVGQEGVARDQAQVRRHGPAVQRVMVDGGRGRFVGHGPAAGAGAAAEVHVFVIEEVIRVEAAEFFPAGPADEQTAAGGPVHGAAHVGRPGVVLADSTRQQQARAAFPRGSETARWTAGRSRRGCAGGSRRRRGAGGRRRGVRPGRGRRRRSRGRG